jgi:hypothetical protein
MAISNHWSIRSSIWITKSGLKSSCIPFSSIQHLSERMSFKLKERL